ncbi:hypothetical protein [Microbaculum sp. FT89]|uniref:hypothetical protein n=1 Tax=Microbaculum sp. FT89 TaxID=3447298 RepID=UPI003F52B626
MTSLVSLLGYAARHGRILLIAGLVAGIALPGAAVVMKAWLPELVALLLFVAALRIGPRQALGAVGDLSVTAGLTLLFQLAIPAAAILVMMAGGWLDHPIALSLVLMLSASSISGSPNLTLLTGNDPAPALRLLIFGTAVLPATVLIPFWLVPELGTAGEVLLAAGRLLGVIAIAGGVAFLIRGFLLPLPAPETLRAIDGLSAIAMAVLVVGLMSAVGPAMVETPATFLFWLAIACAANLGLQVAVAFALRNSRLKDSRAAYSIVAGNRNMALFLVALPASTTDPLLLFIGCYQIPMYLTPILLRRLYRPT